MVVKRDSSFGFHPSFFLSASSAMKFFKRWNRRKGTAGKRGVRQRPTAAALGVVVFTMVVNVAAMTGTHGVVLGLGLSVVQRRRARVPSREGVVNASHRADGTRKASHGSLPSRGRESQKRSHRLLSWTFRGLGSSRRGEQKLRVYGSGMLQCKQGVCLIGVSLKIAS